MGRPLSLLLLLLLRDRRRTRLFYGTAWAWWRQTGRVQGRQRTHVTEGYGLDRAGDGEPWT